MNRVFNTPKIWKTNYNTGTKTIFTEQNKNKYNREIYISYFQMLNK